MNSYYFEDYSRHPFIPKTCNTQANKILLVSLPNTIISLQFTQLNVFNKFSLLNIGQLFLPYSFLHLTTLLRSNPNKEQLNKRST